MLQTMNLLNYFISTGFNCGEATNIATPLWLQVAKEAAIRRASTNCGPMISHYQLLYKLALSLRQRYAVTNMTSLFFYTTFRLCSTEQMHSFYIIILSYTEIITRYISGFQMIPNGCITVSSH